MVQVLLQHGANPLVRNARGRRPIEAATRTKIRRLLRSNVIHSESEEDDDVQVTAVTGDDHDYVTVDLTETSAGEECDVIASPRQQSSRERVDDSLIAHQRIIKGSSIYLIDFYSLSLIDWCLTAHQYIKVNLCQLRGGKPA